MRLSLLFLVWSLAISQLTATPLELRDKDVFYFDQYISDKIALTLERAANVYMGKDFQSVAASLPAGTTVQIIGIGNDGNYLVGVPYRGTNLEGWMLPGDLPPIDPKVMQSARQAQTQRNAIGKAIAEKRVILGMTLEDVKKSLGKPAKASFRQDTQGRIDTWVYITYELIPQTSQVIDAFGRTVFQTVYVKKPIGELYVEFSAGSVTGVEEHLQAGHLTNGVTVPTSPVTTKK